MKVKKKDIKRLIHHYKGMIKHLETRNIFDVFNENEYIVIRINAYKDIVRDLEELLRGSKLD